MGECDKQRDDKMENTIPTTMTVDSFISAFRQPDGTWRYSVASGMTDAAGKMIYIGLYRLPAMPTDAWKKADADKSYQATTKIPWHVELVGVHRGTKNPSVLFGSAIRVAEVPSMADCDMDAVINETETKDTVDEAKDGQDEGEPTNLPF